MKNNNLTCLQNIGVFTSFGSNTIAAAFTCIKYFDGGGFYCPKTTICNNNTTTHGQMFCCIKEHPNHFSLREVNKNMTFILEQINKMSFFQSFCIFCLSRAHVLIWDKSNIISTFYNWQLDDNAFMHWCKLTKICAYFWAKFLSFITEKILYIIHSTINLL